MVFGLRYVWMGYLLALSSEGTHTSEAKFEITKRCPHCGKELKI
ncbi:hypothetical protein NMT12_150152 [metagenome]